jgi:hypothetical protein
MKYWVNSSLDELGRQFQFVVGGFGVGLYDFVRANVTR